MKISPLTRLFRSLAPMFRPPFPGLWLAILLYFVWSFLVYPDSQILRLNFPDPDDYMYLTQVLDWLKGAGWYDNIQHRLNPPNGIVIHFSRLAMLPMAGLTLLFEGLGLGPKGAAMIMALLYPVLLLAGFFAVMRKTAESFMPKDWAGITAYIALFSTALMYMFQPGHVDHHGLMIVIVAAAFGCAVRMMQEPGDFRWGLAAGIILALGMTLALEILPWVLIISAWLGLWAVTKGGNAARHGLVFGLSLYLASILGLLTFRPPSGFFTIDLLTYSIVYVFLAGGIALSFSAAALATDGPRAFRVILGGGVALLGGILFFHQFPDLIAGPYGAMDPELNELVLNEVNEALPLAQRAPSLLILLIHIGAALLALGAGGYFFRRAKPKERWPWGLLLVLLAAAFLLTTFYQCRFGGTMGMLTIIPLAVLLQRGWAWIGGHMRGRKKFWAEIGLLLLVGPLFPVLLLALADGRSFNTGVLLFPVTGYGPDICDTYALEALLRDPKGLGAHPKVIVNDMALGPELLFRTPHTMLAAPYFDTEGNMDAERFFSTPYPQEAEAIARRRHIELAVACRRIPSIYLRRGPLETDMKKPEEDFAPHFIELLVSGNAPDWLHRIENPSLKNFVVYEVLPPKNTAARKPSRAPSK